MLRIFKSKVFILALISILCLILIGITTRRQGGANWLSNSISVPLTPVQSFFSSVGRGIDESFGFLRDVRALRQENTDLKSKVAELENENRELLTYRDKISELREALKLKDEFENYELIGANITAKDAGNWFNVFRIDIGVNDGIDVSTGAEYPVLSSTKGLVGRVLTTDMSSSKVISLIDGDSSVSGWIAKPGGGNVIVKGDLSLKEKGLCRMDYIPVEVDVAVNDVIETSGLGGIYPKGIIIGKVIEIKQTNSELSRYAIIQPAVDFKKLEEVYALKSKAVTNGGAEK